MRTDCASVGATLCRTAGYVCQDTPSGAVCVEGECLLMGAEYLIRSAECYVMSGERSVMMGDCGVLSADY